MPLEKIEPDDLDLHIAGHVNVLKACPFCGDHPIVHSYVNHEPEFGREPVYRSVVSCTDCMATVGYNATTQKEAREQAIILWQNRV